MESINGQRFLVNNMHIYTLYALWSLWTQVHRLGCCLFRVFTYVSCYVWQFSRALVCKNFLASLLGYYKPLVTFFGCVWTGLEDYWSLLGGGFLGKELRFWVDVDANFIVSERWGWECSYKNASGRKLMLSIVRLCSTFQPFCVGCPMVFTLTMPQNIIKC